MNSGSTAVRYIASTLTFNFNPHYSILEELTRYGIVQYHVLLCNIVFAFYLVLTVNNAILLCMTFCNNISIVFYFTQYNLIMGLIWFCVDSLCVPFRIT